MIRNTRMPRVGSLALATALAFAATGASAGEVVTAGLDSGQQFERIIVRFNDGAQAKSGFARAAVSRADAAVAAANRALLGAGSAKSGKGAKVAAAEPLVATHLRPMALGAEVIGLSGKVDAKTARAVLDAIAALPEVESVQVDWMLQHHFIPNDPLYWAQWAFSNPNTGIRAEAAWDLADGSGIRVAVLDTGITNHPDLNANIVPGYDFISSTAVSNDGDGRDPDPSDPGDWEDSPPFPEFVRSSWHGTHVAGTVAATTNNATGLAGTAFNARVMPVRVLGTGGGSFLDILEAITWASGGTVPGVPDLAPGDAADILNLSLGGIAACPGLLQSAIDGAVSRGTTVVVSAGNQNIDAGWATPANCAGVITVASSDSTGARSGFSNYGSSIEITAPGSFIASTLNNGVTVPGAPNYVYYSGTSMAAPHVAGAIALAQSRRLALGLPLWTPAEVESRLAISAYPLPVPCPQGCGPGLLDARALVELAGIGATPVDLALYAVRPRPVTYAREVSFGFNVRSRGPGDTTGTWLEVQVSNRIADLQAQPAAGWTCTETTPTRAARVFQCEHDGVFGAGESARLMFTATTMSPTQVSVKATTGSDTHDAVGSNNSGSMTFQFGY